MNKVSFRKGILLGVVFTLMVLLFTGCNSYTNSSDSSSGNTSALEGTITYWSHNNPAFVNANKKLIEDFEKQFPKIKVNYQNFPYDVTAQKMKASYAAGNEADVIQAFGAWMPPYLKQGVIAEVPAKMSENCQTKFFEAAIAGYMKDGKYYGIPREVNVEYGLYYVPEKVKEAGIDGAPKTFDDVLKVAKNSVKFVNGNLQYGGFEFYNSDDLTFLLLSWIKQLGGDYWASDGKHINFETPQAEQAWQRMIDLITIDKVTDCQHIVGGIQTEQYFFSGRAAMVMKGPWAVAVADELKNKNWAFGVLPPLAGDKPTFVVEPGWGEVVSARSKNLEAAWTFVEFITNEENCRYWNETTGTLPAIKSIAQDPNFINKGSNARIKAAFETLQYAVPMGPVQDSDFLKKTVMDTFNRCVTDKQSPKEGLKYIQDEVNKHIDQLLAQ